MSLDFIITAEEDNYIKVKPGIETDNYHVTIKIQIYDIFIDYTECTKHIGQVCNRLYRINKKYCSGMLSIIQNEFIISDRYVIDYTE